VRNRVLKGDKVSLREPRITDAGPLADYINDPEVIGALPEPEYPRTERDMAIFIEVASQKRDQGSEFHMVVCIGDEDKPIGMCALYGIDKEKKSAQVGYWIAKEHWGKGYGKEALSIALSFGFDELRIRKVYATVSKDNTRSVRLLSSLGFAREKEIGTGSMIMSLTK
jgi:RimJ/RimL family protein N-acetyltransferase